MLIMIENIFKSARNTKKIFLFSALILGTLLFGFKGGGTAYAKDPPALKDTYVIDGITYYNVNSSHINTPQLFYEDLLGATHSSLGGLSIAKYWLLVGAGLLEPGLATSFMYVQSIAQQYLLDGKNNSPLYMFGHSNPEWKDDHVEVQFT